MNHDTEDLTKIRLLFVCMGNICRSPTAHGIFRTLVAQAQLQALFEIDSAGTHSDIWHKGDLADARSVETAHRFDCDISDLHSRQLVVEDFISFDYLIAMDDKNIQDMKTIAPSLAHMDKVTKLLDYAPEIAYDDVPDPYFDNGFDRVYLMIDTACRNLLKTLKKKHFNEI